MSERKLLRLNLSEGIQIRLQTKFQMLFWMLFWARSRSVAAETAVYTGSVHVFGEISANAYVDINRVVRDTIAGWLYQHWVWFLQRRWGFTHLWWTISWYCPGVNRESLKYVEALIKIHLIWLEQEICLGLRWMRQKNLCHFLFHSATSWFVVWQNFVSLGKCFIFVQMRNIKLRLSTMKMIVSARGYGGYFNSTIRCQQPTNHEMSLTKVIKEVIPASYLDDETKFFINPTRTICYRWPQRRLRFDRSSKIITWILEIWLSVSVVVPS